MNVLILPGLYNSGPTHWQSHWEQAFPEFERVQQSDWETPRCADWIEALERVVASKGDDVVLVAHSLACTLVCKWAEKYPRKLRGALLVAPSDTEAPSYPSGTTGFRPMPVSRLPFRAVVVASSNDDYVSLERAQFFANSWGAEWVCIGDAGHIGSASELGMWPAGLKLLAELCGDARFTCQPA